jgi:PAS domain S-box-containing protein
MSPKQILVVAEPAAAYELSARIRSLGHAVPAIAATAAEAVAVAERTNPDVVLIDAALGGGAGALAVAGALDGIRAYPVVFACTEAEEERLGEASTVVTPFGARDLRRGIELAICRRDAAVAMHETESFFAVSIDLFCFLDFSGYFRRLNPAWETTLGYTREELMSRPFIEFVHPDDRERTLGQNRAVRGGSRALGFENRYLCKDGSFRWLLWNSTRHQDERVIYAVARDITARKQAEDDRARLVGELQASLAEVRTLREILPICSYCRKIRDDEDYWESVESYIARHTGTRFSHGICPHCMVTEVEPQLGRLEPRD